jgi:hypothetical protein
MHRARVLIVALLALVLLADGTASAQEAPPQEETPGDGTVLGVGARLNNGTGVVRLYVDPDQNNTFNKLIDEFAPYTRAVSGIVRVAFGDFDGDGNDELVTATAGNLPVKIFDLTSDGRHGAQLAAYGGWPRGAQIATGDINTDGQDELVIGSDRGTATVNIRGDTTGTGMPSTVTDTFVANTQAHGVRVAVGNFDNATGGDVATATGPGVAARIAVRLNPDQDLAVSDSAVSESFLAFTSTFKGGVTLASAEVSGDSGSSLLAGPESGARRVRRWNDIDNDGKVGDELREQFFPYGASYADGIDVAAGDVDRSGSFEESILAPARRAGSTKVRIADDDGSAPNQLSGGTVIQQLAPFAGLTGGVDVAMGKQRTDTYRARDLPFFLADSTTTEVTIRVPESAGFVRDLDLGLSISHTHTPDLDVTLSHGSTNVVLFTDIPSSLVSADGLVIRLNDESGTDIGAATAPSGGIVSGTFNPEVATTLATFDGQDASGTWTLRITDDAAGDTGEIFDWTLFFGV